MQVDILLENRHLVVEYAEVKFPPQKGDRILVDRGGQWLVGQTTEYEVLHTLTKIGKSPDKSVPNYVDQEIIVREVS